MKASLRVTARAPLSRLRSEGALPDGQNRGRPNRALHQRLNARVFNALGVWQVRGAKLVAVSTCHGRLVPAISIIGVCAFRYRTFAGLYSYNFVSQDSDVGQRHLSKTKYP